jgi:hypothetical protein
MSLLVCFTFSQVNAFAHVWNVHRRNDRPHTTLQLEYEATFSLPGGWIYRWKGGEFPTNPISSSYVQDKHRPRSWQLIPCVLFPYFPDPSDVMMTDLLSIHRFRFKTRSWSGIASCVARKMQLSTLLAKINTCSENSHLPSSSSISVSCFSCLNDWRCFAFSGTLDLHTTR